MTKPRMAVVLATMATLVGTSHLAGCGMNRRYANTVIRQLPHSKIAIEYAVNEPEIVRAGTDSSETRPAPGSGKQVLSITYPHPNAKYGRHYAEVTLRRVAGEGEKTADKLAEQLLRNPFRQQDSSGVQSRAKTNTGELRMVLKREELEFLLRDLVADSFFDREERDGGVNLSVSLDSRTTRKKWDHIAAFDQLAARVHSETAKHPKGRSASPKTPSVSAELLAPTPADIETPGATSGSASQTAKPPKP